MRRIGVIGVLCHLAGMLPPPMAGFSMVWNGLGGSAKPIPYPRPSRNGVAKARRLARKRRHTGRRYA